MSRDREFDARMQTFLDSQIGYQAPNGYSCAFQSSDGKKALVVLDLEGRDQNALFVLIRDYFKYQELRDSGNKTE